VHLEEVSIVRLLEKGRVTIPLEVRRALGLEKGARLRLLLDRVDKRIVLEVIKYEVSE